MLEGGRGQNGVRWLRGFQSVMRRDTQRLHPLRCQQLGVVLGSERGYLLWRLGIRRMGWLKRPTLGEGGRGDAIYRPSPCSFMGEGMLQGMLPMVGAFQPRGEHLFLGFPGVICCGVSLPPYQVLQLVPSSEEPVSHDGLDLIFFSSSNQLRRWAAVVGAMLHSFTIRSQQRG